MFLIEKESSRMYYIILILFKSYVSELNLLTLAL